MSEQTRPIIPSPEEVGDNNNEIDPDNAQPTSPLSSDGEEDPETAFKTSSNLSYEKKPLLVRCCGPVRAGSLRGASFAMCSITFGAGCLLFPGAVRITGPFLAIVFFTIVSFAALYTEKLLVRAALKEKVLDYDKLIEVKMGKGMVIFYDINNIIFTMGVIMSYQKGIYEFGLELLHVFFGIDSTDVHVKLYLLVASFLFIQIPLALLKNIAKLQYASIVATISLIFCVVVVDIEMPFYLYYYIRDKKEIPFIEIFAWHKNNYFDTFATFLFGFSCHNGILQVLSELKNPIRRRCDKVLRNSFAIELVLYGTISLCGYFSTFRDTPDYFLTRPNLPFFKKDYFILLAQLTLFVCLHCTMAINYNIMRSSFNSICCKGKNMNFYLDLFIAILCLAGCNAIVFFMDKIIDIIGMFSGFSNTIICFVNPVIIYTRTCLEKRWTWKHFMPYFVLVAMTVTGTICTGKSIVTTIMSLIENIKK